MQLRCRRCGTRQAQRGPPHIRKRRCRIREPSTVCLTIGHCGVPTQISKLLKMRSVAKSAWGASKVPLGCLRCLGCLKVRRVPKGVERPSDSVGPVVAELSKHSRHFSHPRHPRHPRYSSHPANALTCVIANAMLCVAAWPGHAQPRQSAGNRNGTHAGVRRA
jgi:hypothetical protein